MAGLSAKTGVATCFVTKGTARFLAAVEQAVKERRRGAVQRRG
jgi:hypothetical protein